MAEAAIRVPAWKKVGLKLKRPAPSEEVVPPATAEETKPPPPKKLKFEDDETSTRAPEKKRASSKQLEESRNPSQPQPSETNETKPALAKKSKKPANDAPKSSKKSKSSPAKKVSFATSAGDSSAEEYEYPPDRTGFPKEVHSKSSTKKQKKPKKPKTSTSQDSNSVQKSEDPYLDYLQRFHTDRGTWKFNKNTQNHVLHRAFSPHHIPDSHSEALLAYLRGLQGGARERIISSAWEHLKEPGEDSEAADDDFKGLERQRAMAILHALGASKAEGKGIANGSTKARKRKRRTDVEDDDESSENESESEDESSSDESSESSESSVSDSSSSLDSDGSPSEDSESDE